MCVHDMVEKFYKEILEKVQKYYNKSVQCVKDTVKQLTTELLWQEKRISELENRSFEMSQTKKKKKLDENSV